MTTTSYPYPADVKEAVGKAFKALRKNGWVARQSFSCCGGCASYELSSNPKNDGKPSVFYTRQDTADLNDRGFVWLAWGRVGGELRGDDGRALVEALKAEGLHVEWDGNVNRKILVDGMEPEPAPEPEATYLDLYA